MVADMVNWGVMAVKYCAAAETYSHDASVLPTAVREEDPNMNSDSLRFSIEDLAGGKW